MCVCVYNVRKSIMSSTSEILLPEDGRAQPKQMEICTKINTIFLKFTFCILILGVPCTMFILTVFV